MIIDAHVHLAHQGIYPQYWLEGITRNLALDVPDPKIRAVVIQNILNQSLNDTDCSKLLTGMEQANIDRSIVVMADFDYKHMPLSELYRLHYCSMVGARERLFLFGGCDPRRGNEGYDMFERGIAMYGFRGLKLYPPCGFEIDDFQLMPLYEICEKNKLPVLIHIGPSLKGMKDSFDYPHSILKVSERFSSNAFILGHAAIQQFSSSFDLPGKRDNIFLELSGFQAFIESDRAVLNERLSYIATRYPNQLVFGTDWPMFNNQAKAVEYVLHCSCLCESVQEKILHKNIMSLIQ